MANLLKTIIENDKGELRRLEKMADKVLKYEDEMAALTDEQLQAKTEEFKQRYQNGETLDQLLYEAFAVVREGAKRVLGLFPYKVQVMGGIVLHHGDVPEMRTGEGKTLTATMPVYLNALSGKGVHVVTVNEYLTERDATEMGELYSWLGLSVGINLAAKSPMEKKEAYLCDITYSTNSEIGFDYLRDNMVVRAENMVQRPLNYALVDEVDSILIDEARKAVVAKLEEIGALVKIEKRIHSVGHSERTGVVVEPRLSTQWFVKMDQLAKNAIANQDTDDKVEFYPPRFNDTYPRFPGSPSCIEKRHYRRRDYSSTNWRRPMTYMPIQI